MDLGAGSPFTWLIMISSFVVLGLVVWVVVKLVNYHISKK